jgi:hypothetical protein
MLGDMKILKCFHFCLSISYMDNSIQRRYKIDYLRHYSIQKIFEFYSVNHAIYLYLVSININCTNNVCHTLCVVSYMCILLCYNVCCFLYLFLCFYIFCFVILLFLFFKSDINEKKIYLLIVSNVKMKILIYWIWYLPTYNSVHCKYTHQYTLQI